MDVLEITMDVLGVTMMVKLVFSFHHMSPRNDQRKS